MAIRDTILFTFAYIFEIVYKQFFLMEMNELSDL